MEFDYFLVFSILAILVMIAAVFGRRGEEPYGDQYYSGNTPYPQSSGTPPPPPPQPIVIITKNETIRRTFGGGEGFAALLVLSLVIYFYVSGTEENPATKPATEKPAMTLTPTNTATPLPATVKDTSTGVIVRISPDGIE